MHRLLAILLIPFFVVGNSFVHSHGSAAHQSPSHGRAHFHVGSTPQHGHTHESHGHSHHEHGHGHVHHGQTSEQKQKRDDSKPSPIEKTVDHESDAIYIAAADYVFTTSARISIEMGSGEVVKSVEDYVPCTQPDCWRERPPLTSPPGLPLYLLHSALRL
jgi:hypothetical protein